MPVNRLGSGKPPPRVSAEVNAVRVLLQRVVEASVTVGGQEVGSSGTGLVVFLGVTSDDDEADAHYLVDKTVNLRIFADEQSRFNRSALDVKAELLVVSQFTLYAETRKGRRPDFNRAAPPSRPNSSTITRWSCSGKRALR